MKRLLAFVLTLISSILIGTSAVSAIEVDAIFLGTVEDREQDANLTYVFVATVIGDGISGGRVFRPGNPTPICTLDAEEATCNIIGTSLNDFCTQFGFGDFIIEIDAAIGMNDSVTLFFDPGCTDPFPGNVDITSPLAGQDVPPIPGPNVFCWDCVNCPDVYQLEIIDYDIGDLRRNVSVPNCWDPGICLQTFNDQEFRASAIQLFSDFVPTVTDNGDDFSYISFFQNANLERFDVTDPTPTTPPAVPAGTGASFPMLAQKIADDGSSIELFWDADSCCAVSNHHLVYATGSDLPAMPGGTYNLDGSLCNLGPTGDLTWNSVPTPPAGDFLWWLMLTDDLAATEGSWGHDGMGNERTGPGAGGVSGQCGMTTKSLANGCGR